MKKASGTRTKSGSLGREGAVKVWASFEQETGVESMAQAELSCRSWMHILELGFSATRGRFRAVDSSVWWV